MTLRISLVAARSPREAKSIAPSRVNSGQFRSGIVSRVVPKVPGEQDIKNVIMLKTVIAKAERLDFFQKRLDEFVMLVVFRLRFDCPRDPNRPRSKGHHSHDDRNARDSEEYSLGQD